MSLSARHLLAIEKLVGATCAARGAGDPSLPEWQGLLAAVKAERAAANDTTAATDTTEELVKLGAPVFALDLPLQIEKPRAKPRLLFAKPGDTPQPIKGKLASRLFGDQKKARVALRSWANLPAGSTVPFKGGAITADWSPIVLVLAPTMNALRGMPTFAKQNARKEIAERIVKARVLWPAWAWGGQRETVMHGGKPRSSPVGGRRRYVRVTRFSSRRPDDMSPDVIGSKMALDQIVQAGILGDDSAAWCEREGQWKPANPGEGFLRVEVFELEGEAGIPRPAAARKKAPRQLSITP